MSVLFRTYGRALLLLAISALGSTESVAQWLNANPGAGGQLQHVVCDPNHTGRMYLCSDMEGYYVSEDFGDHWQYKGWESPFSFVFNIAVEPGNSDRMYMTSSRGMAISDDGGASWDVEHLFKGISIATISVNPKNKNQICMAESWLETVIGQEQGVGRVFYSNDRGETWQLSQFLDQSTNKNIYSINFYPTEEKDDILVSCSDGIFITKDYQSWDRIASPENAKSCRGCDLSPDGKWLYAVYIREDGNTGLYVKKYEGGNWQELDPEGYLQACDQTHWRPRVWSNSDDSTHYVLLGTLETGGSYLDNALTEGRFLVKDDMVYGHVNKILSIKDDTEPFDVGWNAYWSHCRTYDYYPKSWDVDGLKRGVFAMSQQSTFRGDAAKPDEWVVNTCHLDHSVNDTRFYTTNGTSSTWVWDIAGLDNYVVMGMGDNGVAESWDNGRSWTQKYAPAFWNVDALEIVKGNETIALAGRTDGFGGALYETKGYLYYRELDVNHPDWGWNELIDGKADTGLKGLNAGLNRIASIQSDPHKPERVYVGTNDALYVTEDIFELIGNNPAYYFKDISKSEIGSTLTRRIHVDPNDPDILYLRSWKGTYRIEKRENGAYDFIKLKVDGSDQNLNDGWGHNGDISVWKHDTATYLMLTRNIDPHWELWLSADRGDSFTRILTKDEAFAIRPPGEWFINQKPVIYGGLCGTDSLLFTSVHIRGDGEGLTKGISFLKGTIQADQSIVWEDFTGNPREEGFWFPAGRSGKIWKDESGSPALHIATMGAGMWKRSLEETSNAFAAFSSEPSTGNLPLEVNFDASDSRPSESAAEIVAYQWDFGNGYTANGQTVSHIFTEQKVFTVKLSVRDELGNTGHAYMNIEVRDYGPVADFVASTYRALTGHEIQFYGELSYDENPDDSIVSWEWDFKDREAAEGKNVIHTYADWAMYNVTLTVRNSQGQSSKISKRIRVDLNTAAGEGEGSRLLCVFPNPVNDILEISFPEHYSLNIFNSMGQEIYCMKDVFGRHQISTASWESGLYIISVQQDDVRASGKIIKP